MATFWSWLGSQSGVSLIVSVIALIGVVATTAWNNRAADERRIADQAAEDKRRKDDDARRERERLEQLKREDWSRQRRAVADCVSGIYAAVQVVEDAVAAARLDTERRPYDKVVFAKAVALNKFSSLAAGHLNQCDLEVTQPHVSAQIGRLWEQIAKEQAERNGADGDQSNESWMARSLEAQPLSEQTLFEIRKLTIIARLALLEHPEHMETQPVEELQTALDEMAKDSSSDSDDDASATERAPEDTQPPAAG